MDTQILTPTVLLGGTGLSLVLAAKWIARLAVQRAGAPSRDPIGLERSLRVAGFILVIAALVVRPENPTTAAIPQKSALTSPEAR